MDSAVTFIVCGTLNPHETLPTALKPTLDAGIIDQAIYDLWVGAAQGMYQDNPQLQRDEAICSGSLAAMTLMLKGSRVGIDAHDRIRPVVSGAGVWSLRDGDSSDVDHRWLSWLGQLATIAS